jgi:DNA-binding NarL/FixJ family response regulator
MTHTLLALTGTANLRAALKPLRGSGLRVLQARTGLAALLLCACRPVDVAVMNLEEPGMDWPRVREKLCAAFPGLPVVAMTERDEPELLAQRIRETIEAVAPRKHPLAEHASAAGSAHRRSA